MRRRGQACSASVLLEPGRRYGFRYRDSAGGWFDDDTADVFEDNGFGGSNAVVDLSETS